jgi:hypothetical protein
MSPKNTGRVVEEAPIATQHIENVETRSIYGDNHAATEDALLAAHATQLRESNIIGDGQATELSRPRRHRVEHRSNYSHEYLAMHPSYTGQNLGQMPTLETARDHQKIRDRAMQKLLDDYNDGKVDKDGNPIVLTDEDTSSSQTASPPSASDPALAEIPGPRRVPSMHHAQPQNRAILSSQGSFGTPSQNLSDRIGGDAFPMRTARDNAASGVAPTQRHRFQSDAAKQPTEPSNQAYVPSRGSLQTQPQFQAPPTAAATQNPRIPSRKTLPILLSSDSSGSSTPSKPLRKKYVEPVEPLPGYPDYRNHHYEALLAICRLRKLKRGGNVQEVRNRIIRDDRNVVEGRPREQVEKVHSRKSYKHQAPEDIVGRSARTFADEGADRIRRARESSNGRSFGF